MMQSSIDGKQERIHNLGCAKRDRVEGGINSVRCGPGSRPAQGVAHEQDELADAIKSIVERRCVRPQVCDLPARNGELLQERVLNIGRIVGKVQRRDHSLARS